MNIYVSLLIILKFRDWCILINCLDIEVLSNSMIILIRLFNFIIVVY